MISPRQWIISQQVWKEVELFKLIRKKQKVHKFLPVKVLAGGLLSQGIRMIYKASSI